MTLRSRLTAAFLAVVLGPVLIGAVFVGITVSEVSNHRATGRLDTAVTMVRSTVNAACRELRSAASTAARLYGAGTATDRVDAARDGVETGLATAVQISDPDGRKLSTAGELSGPWVDCASRGSAGVERPGALIARIRMADSAGRTVGQVVAGIPVDADFVNRLHNSAGVGVTIPSHRAPLSTETPTRAEAVAIAAGRVRGTAIRSTPEGLFVRAVPRSDGQPLHLALSTARADSQALYAVLVGVVVLAGLVAVGAAWWLANSTTQPLFELASAADRVAGGDLDARVPVRSRDEVGKLGSAFNRMTREMQAYVSALTASRDQLRGNLGLLGDTLARTHDLDGILTVILKTAMAATGAQAGVVLLVDKPDGKYPNQLVARCADGLDERARSLSDVRVRLGEGLLGAVALAGEPRRGRVVGIELARYEPRCRTYIAVPFTGSGRDVDGAASTLDDAVGRPPGLRGVLALYDRLGQDDFDDADLGTLRTFAGQAAVAVDNVLLHQETARLSLTDDLTELWNYRYLRVSLYREVERATRFSRQLSVLAMDLDRFKEVNDTYGHSSGDAVLMAFANRIQAEIREVDLACRQGGEEFVVLLPETDEAGASRLADRICASVRGMTVPLQSPSGGSRDGEPAQVQVTVSIGVAVYPDHGATGQDVLDAADDALYEAKAAGRDTWRVASRSAGPRPARLRARRLDIDDDPDPSAGPVDPSDGASRRPRPPRQTRGG
ncbi:MAG: diguanylate cyclase [Actinocatenispora sp.]